MKKGLIRMPPEEKLPPRYEQVRNMIPERLKTLSRIDYETLGFQEARAQRASLAEWGTTPGGELRPDTTGIVHKGLGEAVWALINAAIA